MKIIYVLLLSFEVGLHALSDYRGAVQSFGD